MTQLIEKLVMIRSINHITLIVRDMRRSADLFMAVFGAAEHYVSPITEYSRHPEIFLQFANIWLVLMEDVQSKRTKTYDHIAFQIERGDVDQLKNRLLNFGVELVPSRPRRVEEAESIYFYDFDNHLFELHTGSIAERLEFYKSNRVKGESSQ